MRNILLIGISLVLLTAGTALAVKPDNPGGDKKDVINGLSGTINVYDGNNNRIGSLLLYSPSTNIYVLTDRDYAFSVSRFGGLISRNFYFSTSDCTGQAYILPGDDISSNLPLQGFVLINDFKELYYIPKGSEEETVVLTSRQAAVPPCQVISDRTAAFPVFPNDPRVTGVSISNSPFQGPITVGH